MYINSEELDRLVKIFHDFSFEPDQIRRIIKKYRFYKDRVDKIIISFPFYLEQMKKLGYTEYEARELAIYKPSVMFCRFCRGRFKESYKEYIKNLKQEVVNQSICFDHDGIIEILKDLGLSDRKISIILAETKDILFLSPEELKKNIEYYNNHGLTNKDLVTICGKNIKILTYGEEYYRELLDIIKEFDMTMDDICDILRRKKKNASFTAEYVIEIFKWAKDKKLNKTKFKNGIKKTPILLNTRVKRFVETYKNFQDIGFNDQQVNCIIEDAISVTMIDIELIKDKMAILKEYNLTDEEILDFVSNYPGYLTMSIENIREKLKVAEEIGTLRFIFRRPKNLIQGTNLTLARAYILNKYHPNVEGHEFSYTIYYPERHFLKKTGMTNEQVINAYNKSLMNKKLVYRQEV